VNFATPLALGELLIALEEKYGGGEPSPEPRSFWPYLWAYVGLRYLQSSGGLSALRDVSTRARVVWLLTRCDVFLTHEHI
jgi:ATP-binding cassette subfamily B (MDR/TAP) protein 6